MKSLLLFITYTLALFANELQYEHNLDKAIEKANQQHKEVRLNENFGCLNHNYF